MDLERVLRELALQFRDRQIRYGLTGGYAVALYGHARTTVDLDFLVDREDLGKVDQVMGEMGYEIRHRSENVSQFLSSEAGLGEVDFIHAFRRASIKMLERARPVTLFPDGPALLLLAVEDVIGLKIQAIANAPHRKSQDLADIQNLAALHKDALDWELIESYCSVFDMSDLAERLKAGEWQA